MCDRQLCIGLARALLTAIFLYQRNRSKLIFFTVPSSFGSEEFKWTCVNYSWKFLASCVSYCCLIGKNTAVFSSVSQQQQHQRFFSKRAQNKRWPLLEIRIKLCAGIYPEFQNYMGCRREDGGVVLTCDKILSLRFLILLTTKCLHWPSFLVVNSKLVFQRACNIT